ncbi:helix-turn-helix domain-containing protein [Sphingobacterium sp. LRF_L2]|uniref:helix-turn-helix domain-containing protein n=1 Tax=Sphingobacterium sp. LRF_L2 TaxID=3369421 RepID=UPI003F61823A
MHTKNESINTLTLNDLVPGHHGFVIKSLRELFGTTSPYQTANKRTYYCIMYLIDGPLALHIDQRRIILKPQEIIALNPNCVMKIELANSTPEGWLILFEESFFTQRYNDNMLYHFAFLKEDFSQALPVSSHEQNNWATVIQAMQKEYEQRHADAKNILRSYLNIILGTLERNMQEQPIVSRPNEKEEKIIAFERLLNEHFKTQRFPSFYADRLFISTNYLNRLCQARRGISAGQIIRNRILQESERLLLHTFKNISEIAFELGFESAPYFITFFKRKHLQSPEEYRKKFR